ncbi:MAG: ImmA/IrrE family metallo-endopeptidase [Okeania sp. SIO2D1]|nr:ImmA/IrrE family metallo-endopeptidase [Okeania sp. SIO2D1]
MTFTLTMSSLIAKLSLLGFNDNYIKSNGLPSWWDDELNNKPFAVLEGAGYIADRLNLDLKSLLDETETVKFNHPPQTKFKQRSSKHNKYPDVAQALASRVAELIAFATEVNFTPLPTNVKEIRAEILKISPTVNLTSLLKYCWHQGIIIAYFNNFPESKTIKKIAGLIQWQSNSPVIILSSTYTQPALIAFDLAHELGHLVLGHLQDGLLVDEEINSNCNDDEENQANKFATELLLDNCAHCLENNDIYNHEQLIKLAQEKAKENPTVEPEFIVLNHAWHHPNNWGNANKALDKLDPERKGQQIINEYLADRIDWDKLNDENYEYLERVLGV